MNLETFNKVIVPTLGNYRMTEKGFFRKFRVQSIYKTEFPFNNEYERFFLIEDKVYKLSEQAKLDVKEAFKTETDVNGVVFTKVEATKTSVVNVPFERFILISEDTFIVVNKERNYDTIKIEEVLEEKELETQILKEAKNMVDNSFETTQDFQDFIKGRLNYIEKTLITKGREYTNSNWLDNFEEACRFKGLEVNSTNLIKILDGYRLKHQISIVKLQNDIANGKSVSIDLINEKYGDLMNYNLLEQAIILKYNHLNKISF